jgi:hypothetical protein
MALLQQQQVLAFAVHNYTLINSRCFISLVFSICFYFKFDHNATHSNPFKCLPQHHAVGAADVGYLSAVSPAAATLFSLVLLRIKSMLR